MKENELVWTGAQWGSVVLGNEVLSDAFDVHAFVSNRGSRLTPGMLESLGAIYFFFLLRNSVHRWGFEEIRRAEDTHSLHDRGLAAFDQGFNAMYDDLFPLRAERSEVLIDLAFGKLMTKVGVGMWWATPNKSQQEGG